jgi:hypothetical protein
VILATDAVRHARQKLLELGARMALEEHQMSWLDLARIQFVMTLTNRLQFVPGSIDLAANTNSDGFPHWLVGTRLRRQPGLMP